jgi:hypothetical protein
LQKDEEGEGELGKREREREMQTVFGRENRKKLGD